MRNDLAAATDYGATAGQKKCNIRAQVGGRFRSIRIDRADVSPLSRLTANNVIAASLLPPPKPAANGYRFRDLDM